MEDNGIFRLLITHPEHAQKTLETDSDEADPDDITQRLYVSDTCCAWQKSNGTQEWLLRYDDSPHGSTRTAATQVLQNEKRWIEALDMAEKFAEREQFKDAKRYYRQALKEAQRREGDQRYNTVIITLMCYLQFLNETDHKDEIVGETIDAEIARIAKDETCTPAQQALVLRSMGRLLLDIGQSSRSLELSMQALPLLESLLQSDSASVSLSQVSEAELNIGIVLGDMERFAEAAQHFQRSVESSEQYLGSEHPNLDTALDYWWRALHKIGKHQEESEVRYRQLRIASFYDDPDDMDDDPDDSDEDTDYVWYVERCAEREAKEKEAANLQS
jgi:tetratricopeptide (TPR) repeat protein